MDDRTIWKFELDIVDSQVMLMPRGAKILTVQTQLVVEPQDHNHVEPHIWALVDPQTELVGHGFLVAGTGHTIDTKDAISGEYVGTFQMHGGALIWHVFDMGEIDSGQQNKYNNDDETDIGERGKS